MEAWCGGGCPLVCTDILRSAWLDIGITRMLLLPQLGTLMEDWDRDVTWAKNGVLHLPHKGLLGLLRAWFWWYVGSVR